MKRGIFIILFCIATILFGQPFPQRIEKPSPDYYGGLYFGINGLGRCYYETGYSASIYSKGNESKTFKLIDMGLMVGDFKNKNFLVAPKIGLGLVKIYESGFGPSIGFQIIKYTDFNKNALSVKPTIGIDYFRGLFDLVYGYNYIIQNNGLESPALNKHTISLRFRIGTMVNAYNK